MKPPIRVAVVEDKAPLRQQYERLLNEAEGFTCCGAFADAESAQWQSAATASSEGVAGLGSSRPSTRSVVDDIGLRTK